MTIDDLLTLPAGRRAKYVVLAVSLLVVGALASQAGKLSDALRDDPASTLPSNADSLRVREAEARFPSAGRTSAVVVYRREGGLTAADGSRIEADRRRLDALGPPIGASVGPQRSEDGAAALLVVPVTDDGQPDTVPDTVDAIREVVGAGDGGLRVAVTGGAGFEADIANVFDGLDVDLLLGTGLLVLVLLILIYRSPVFWIVPFVTVALAEGAVRGLTSLAAEAGVTVSPQSSGIVSVLVFGAGTDYALLLVARYREELRRVEDPHDAMATTMRTAGPAVFASGATVAAGLLVLALSVIGSTAGLGPIAAIGVTVAMLAMLTILPAALVVVGRRAFWPFVPRVAEHADPATRGAWRWLGERVARRPRLTWIVLSAVLGVVALGVLRLDTTLAPTDLFREEVEAVTGQELLQESFPAGSSATATVFLPGADRARAEQVAGRLEQESDLVSSVAGIETGAPGALVDVVVPQNPFGAAAVAAVPALRRAAREAGGPAALVGGETAESYDQRQAAWRDNLVVVPVALLAVLVILALLLRAVVAPLLLVATVVLSFGAALGASAVLFDLVFGFGGADPTLVLIAFVFLIALGVDYNIFLMTRVREETLAQGTREGMLRGLAVTGAVITSAGIVLAGAFSILAVLPIVVLTQIGVVIGLGVLIDTFLVRSVLVPALAFDLDRRIWWPSSLSRRSG
ncbi:MAG TPA: MMPL family transporter [Gaiellaceae bacterium]|nr:MMPL family transporter [Gaiellaceae bacterium]